MKARYIVRVPFLGFRLFLLSLSRHSLGGLLIAHATPQRNSVSNPERDLYEGRFRSIIFRYISGYLHNLSASSKCFDYGNLPDSKLVLLVSFAKKRQPYIF
jgi:hypothetical protein